MPPLPGIVRARVHGRYHSSFILMAEIMGAGLLGLPYAMSKLGWIVGLTTSVLGAFFCTYSGTLLSRVRHELGYTEAESYYDVALGTGGPIFGSVVRGTVFVSWGAVLPYFLLACADSLHEKAMGRNTRVATASNVRTKISAKL